MSRRIAYPGPLHDLKQEFNREHKTFREDVECAFGVLKGRFRCLKLPIYFENKCHINYMFYTCCMLHNMLLHFDGLDVRWERNINYLGRDGNHSLEDMTIFRQHISRVRKSKSISTYFASSKQSSATVETSERSIEANSTHSDQIDEGSVQSEEERKEREEEDDIEENNDLESGRAKRKVAPAFPGEAILKRKKTR